MANEIEYDKNLTLDEIVFENRNKEYGAYDLRSSYRKVLTKSFVLGTILFCVVAITPFVVMKIKQMNAADKTEVKSNLIDILPEEEPILDQPEDTPPPPPPPPVEPPKIEVIQNVVPEPVKAPKVETPPPPISDQMKTQTGLQNQEGVKTPAYTPPPPPPSTGTSTSTVEVKPQVSTTEVYETVDQGADFGSGGIAGFRKKFQEGFDNESMEGEGSVKTEITFVVERDGSISNVKATGSNSGFNKEAERTIKAIKGKWSPGKVNGQPVRSRFRFPITMQFE